MCKNYVLARIRQRCNIGVDNHMIMPALLLIRIARAYFVSCERLYLGRPAPVGRKLLV
jgi:hypothetical protein